MRIVIDLQGAQTERQSCGIGRYSLALAKAMVRHRGKHEIIIVLSGLIPDTIRSIREEFDDIFPQENICIWEAPGSVNEVNPRNIQRRETAELIREAFLLSLQPDVILVTNLFEDFFSNAVTSINKFKAHHKTAVIFHDLIPFLFPEQYLTDDVCKRHYLDKIKSLQKVNLLLSVSTNSKKDAIDKLNFDPDKIAVISSAVEEQFKPMELRSCQEVSLKKRYKIDRKFLMFTPGVFDSRKNFSGLIQAYALLSEQIRLQHQLVIVSKITIAETINLRSLAKKAGLQEHELVLTGYVPDEDLIALYSIATLVVFPSKYEGFGLPVLEAMSCGAPTIASNTSSIPEVIGNEEAMFDPHSIESIAKKMQRVLEDVLFRKRLKEHAHTQKQKFSWEKTASKTLELLGKFTYSSEKIEPRLQSKIFNESDFWRLLVSAIKKLRVRLI